MVNWREEGMVLIVGVVCLAVIGSALYYSQKPKPTPPKPTPSDAIWTVNEAFDDYDWCSKGCLFAVRGTTTGNGNDGVFVTADYGETWRQLFDFPDDPASGREIFVDSRNNIFASPSSGNLWRSTDGGSTWEKVLQIAPTVGGHVYMAEMLSNGDLYAATHSSTNKVFKSTDGGSTWVTVMDKGYGNDINHIAIDQKTNWIYVLDDGAPGVLRRSKDGGSTWTRIFASGAWEWAVEAHDRYVWIGWEDDPGSGVARGHDGGGNSLSISQVYSMSYSNNETARIEYFSWANKEYVAASTCNTSDRDSRSEVAVRVDGTWRTVIKNSNAGGAEFPRPYWGMTEHPERTGIVVVSGGRGATRKATTFINVEKLD